MNHLIQTSVLLSSLVTQLLDQMPEIGSKLQEQKSEIDKVLVEALKDESLLLGEEDEAKWPKVNVPYNSEVTCDVFYLDWETKELESFADMTINKYIDSNGNRALSMVSVNLPLTGKTQCNHYYDFSNRKLVRSVVGKDWCQEITLPEVIRL